jgi:hypothetical protein
MSRLTKSQIAKIEAAIEQHERHKNAYFWTPRGNASDRRRTEDQNNYTIKFRHDGHEYSYTSSVRCSCKNYYYSGTFALDGEEKTIRLFKGLLKNQERVAA